MPESLRKGMCWNTKLLRQLDSSQISGSRQNFNFRNQTWGCPGDTSGKEPACSAGDKEGCGSVLGSGRALVEGEATHSTALVGRIPWTEELAGSVHSVAKSWA